MKTKTFRPAFKRLTAAATALSLLWTQTASPLAAADLWTDRRAARGNTGPKFSALRPQAPLGRVTQSFDPAAASPATRPDWARGWDLSGVQLEAPAGPRPDVLIVRDIHAQEQAQKRIAAFLTSLSSEGLPVLVGVEGASGPLDFRAFRAAAPADAVRRLADAYLSWDWIQAPEYAGLTGPETMRFYGVETPSLYDGNIRAYRQASAVKQNFLRALDTVSAALAPVKERLLTPEQAELDARAVRYCAGTEDTVAYLEFLAADVAPQTLSRFPQSALLIEIRALEKTLDLRRAETERTILLQSLADKLPADTLRALTETALLLRAGEGSAGAFHAALLSLARDAGIARGSFPVFEAYARYAARADDLDRERLLAEIVGLEEAAWKARRPSPEQDAFRRLTDDLSLARRLADHALTDSQWETWESRLPRLREVPDRARTLGAKWETPELPLGSFENFYRYAGRRDKAMLDNFLAVRRGKETAVLVAGGFHASGMAKALHERGLTTAIVTPRLDAFDRDKNALSTFTMKASLLDRLLAGRRVFLASRVSIGVTGAPPAPGEASFKKPALWAPAAASIAAVTDPDRAEEFLEKARAVAEKSPQMPLKDFGLSGPVRRAGGRLSVPVHITEQDKPSIRAEAVTDAEGLLPQPLLPGPVRALTQDGKEVPLSFGVKPTVADRAARVSRRLLLPALDGAVWTGAAMVLGNPWSALAFTVLFRLGVMTAAYQNERGHLLRAGALGLKDVWTRENRRGNLPWRAWAAMAVPFTPSLWGAPHVTWGGSTKEQDLSVRRRGMVYGSVLSLATAAAVSVGMPEAHRLFSLAFALGVGAGLFMALASDVLLKNIRDGMAWCGIEGGVYQAPGAALPGVEPLDPSVYDGRDMDVTKRRDGGLVPELVRSFNVESAPSMESRGKHSRGFGFLRALRGGLVEIFRVRVVNAKRDSLIEKLWRRVAWLSLWTRVRVVNIFVYLGHVRVSTSSAPTEKEAHPHQWLPNRIERVWTPVLREERAASLQESRGRWARALARFTRLSSDAFGKTRRGIVSAFRVAGNLIAANGDFNVLKFFGDFQGLSWQGLRMSNGEVGDWLGRILGVKDGLKGDSPKIAGMMDLLHTQGRWGASARLAYQLTAATSPRDPAPSPKTVQGWGRILDDLFEEFLKSGKGSLIPDGIMGLNQIPAEAREAMIARLSGVFAGDAFSGMIPRAAAGAMARETVNAFCDNDLNASVKTFMKRAEGTFGLGVISSLTPDRMIVATRGQSVFLGFDPARGMAHASSDGTTFKFPFGRAGGERAPFHYRLQTDPVNGEVIEMSQVSGDGAATLRVYSEILGRELTADELSRSERLELLDAAKNPYITPIPERHPKDPVKADLQDTPGRLKAIREDWKNPASFNARAGEELSRMLLERKNPRLVLYGFTENHWMLEEFKEDLQDAFPGLRVEVLYPNKIVRKRKALPVEEDDIVLAVSHSGQTAPTNGASVALQKKYRRLAQNMAQARKEMRREGNDAFFTLTGEMDSLLGTLTGQKYNARSKFRARNMTNLTGFRESEAVTVTTTATQATLSELLLTVGRRALADGKGRHGFALTAADLETLEKRRDFSAYESSEQIVGAKDRATAVRAQVALDLSRNGSRLFRHFSDAAAGLFIVIAYAFCARYFEQVPLLPGQGLQVLLGWALEGTTAASGPWWDAIRIVPSMMDALWIGLVSTWTFVLGWRMLGNRQLLARVFGTRRLIFTDVKRWVAKSNGVLARKMGNLSFAHAAVHPSGGDYDDYAQEDSHDAGVRGNIQVVGLADARLSEEIAEDESAGKMVGKQSNTSQHYGAGPETVTIGHNPAHDANASRYHVVLPDPKIDAARMTPAGRRILDRFNAMDRSLAMQVLNYEVFRRISRWIPFFRYKMHVTRGGARTATTSTFHPMDGVFEKEEEETGEETSLSFEGEPVPLPFRVGVPSPALMTRAPDEELRPTTPAQEAPPAPSIKISTDRIQPQTDETVLARPRQRPTVSAETMAALDRMLQRAPDQAKASERPVEKEVSPLWLEIRRDQNGALDFRYMSLAEEGFRVREASPRRMPEIRRRTEKFLSALRTEDGGRVHVLRVPLTRSASLEGFEHFLKNPETSLYLSLDAYRNILNEDAPKEGPVKGSLFLGPAGEALPTPAVSRAFDAPRPDVAAEPLDDHTWEIVMEHGAAWHRSFDPNSADDPQWLDVDQDDHGAVTAFQRALHWPSGSRLVLRIRPNAENEKSRDPRRLEGAAIELTREEFDYLKRHPAQAAEQTRRNVHSFGNPTLALLPLLLGPAGILAALAASAREAAAAVSIGAGASGDNSFATLILGAAAIGIFMAQARRSARATTIRSASNTADEVDLKNGLPAEAGRRLPAMILHVQARQAASFAAVVAAETVRRRERGEPVPAVYLAVEKGDVARARRRFMEGLAEWDDPRKGPLSPNELKNLEKRIAAGPTDAFLAPSEDASALDGGLAEQAAGRALGLGTETAWLLLSPQGKMWLVPEALKGRMAVLDLQLPTIGKVLSAETWKAWLAVATSA